MVDPYEYSSSNIALDNMQDISRIKNEIDELETRVRKLELIVNKNTNELNELTRIFYLKRE